MFKNWSLFRVVRLLIGLYIVYEATEKNEFILYFIGGFLLLHALLNISCTSGACTGGQCDNSSEKLKTTKGKI